MMGLRIFAGLIGVVAGFAGSFEARGDEQASGPNVRVGTFDSRAVAIAFYRSQVHQDEVAALQSASAKAATAGEHERVSALKAEGKSLQALAHKQSFSTWPVDSILERIRTDLPKIAAAAGVDLIVSKWGITYQASGIDLIDVTDLLVKPFRPDQETLKILESLRGRPPVALEEMGDHDH